MLRAVIFDFDGVISDTELLHLRAFNNVLAGYGIEISKDDYFDKYLGLTDLDLIRELTAQGLLKGGEKTAIEAAEKKKVVFENISRDEAEIIEGVREFIAMLYDNRIPMAIFSGALLAEIELILQSVDLRRYFEIIVSAEHVTKAKPDPEGFVLALKRLNIKLGSDISPSQCVVIEDSHWGLEAAIKAGMHTVAVTNSYKAEQLTMAEKVVKNLAHLTIDELRHLCAR
ncbi:MAG: HAD family phosphatase [Candidatus Brocadiia bacterium]|nr:MAG: HAD family phosphatase [Candidatus Brocadiia bacterium]